MLRTETDVKYIGDLVVIVPLDVPVSSTYEHLLSMIYSRIGIDKKQFQLVLNCRYPLKRENRFQPCPIWDDNSLSQMLKLVNTFGMDEIELYIEQVQVQPRLMGQLLGNFTQLLLGQNDNVEEFEYGSGPSSAPIAMTYECKVDEYEEECESQEGDDQSERAEDVQRDGDGMFKFIDEENNNVNVVSSFLALHKAMESEQGRYVSVDREGYDMSNNPDPEDLIEFSPVQYHLAPSLQFENVENIGNSVSSDWTPWGNANIGNLGGEFMVGQVFNSKADLQHAVKLYSISAHQEYIVVSSTTKLLVLRCKKAEQSQCRWKLHAMVVKGTTSFTINKYDGPHKCVNPCLNRDHQQLDSNLIAAHIQGMINAQFTLLVTAIQARFKHCRLVLSIDGTHLYGKYKCTLIIAMGCNGNNQLFPLAFALTKDMEYRGHSSNPDPLDTSVLVLQDRHRSHLVDSGQLASVLTCRQHISRFMQEWEMDPRLRPYIIRSGFLCLVERWCLETHTFHLPVGEMTITLQDVVVILGLRIHGLPIIDTCDIDWSPTSEIKGSMISTLWLCHQFSHPLVDSDDATLERYARAFILGLIGSTLFTDKKDETFLDEGLLADPLGYRWRVPLSWAQNPSRVLTFYRDQLDAQTHDQPYMGDLVAHLPVISLADQEIWRTMSPLIFFDIVEWHRPERVLRQFGLQQGIPPSCSIEQDLHSVDRRGRHKYDWGAFHAQYITLWASRAERIAMAPPMVGAMQFHDPYME
uniref:Serine/threonine-protein phosphatase 7 long form-like n=1 Tax=Vitis vinifera TaxID=29760 RepID=A5ADK7_VITVI|nr:hypothetical protein VITISV_006921 [Vitis vinifera]